MVKLLTLATLLAAAPALAQTGEPYPYPYPEPAPAQQAPQATPQATPQQSPQQGAPQQGGQQQGGTSGTVGGTAGTGGTASSAGGGGAAGTSSQQVVVNPPTGRDGAPVSSTTVVNPPAYSDVVVTEARNRRNPFETVAIDAAYGGLAGLLVGTGVALVDDWDNWDRKLMVGAGIGVIVGAAVGVVHAGYDARESHRTRRVAAARDGLGSPDRDPVLANAGTVLGYAGRF